MSHLYLGIFMDGETLRLALISRGLRGTRLVDCLRLEGFLERSKPELQNEIGAFLGKNKAVGCRSVLVLPRSEFIVRKLELPVAAQVNLPKVVEYQLASLLPSEEAEICYDFFVSKAGKDAKAMGVTVFVLLKSVVEAKLRTCESAGLKIERVVPSSAVLASCLEALQQRVRKPALLFCYAVGTHCEMASFAGGLLQQVQELPCSSEEELLQALQRETKVFRSQAQVPEAAPVDAFLFSPVHRIWERETQDRLLKFHAISNLVQLGLSRGKTTLDAQEVKDDFLPVMAALTSFKRRNPYAINLLPPEKRVEKSLWASVPVCLLLGINLIFLLALSLRKPVQQEIYSRQLQREVRRLEPEVKKIRQVETQIDTYQKRAELLTNFKKSTAVNLGAWNELSTLLPKNSWITNFALKDQSVEITGMSDEASKLLQILDRSPYFRKAEFTAPITRDGLGKEVFLIRMAIEASSPQSPPIAQASAEKESK
ncbi:MAG: hypothetical protein EXQ58_09750 [Acidobacteria bacterium]|nr:hypothetical protein [Acidobacteriota bacterium]